MRRTPLPVRACSQQAPASSGPCRKKARTGALAGRGYPEEGTTVSAERALLVITAPAWSGGDVESIRVALDILRASAQVRTVAPANSQEMYDVLGRRGRRRPVVL